MKGKYAATAARQRADEAQQRASALESAVAAERVEWARERDALRAEAQGLRSQLGREVRELAEAEIAAVRLEAEVAVTEVREQHRARVLAGISELMKHVPEVERLAAASDKLDPVEVAEAFGIQVGDFFGLVDFIGARNARRVTNGAYRKRVREIEWDRAQGSRLTSRARNRLKSIDELKVLVEDGIVTAE